MNPLAPGGRFAIGTAVHEMVDPHRPAHACSDAAGRRLLLKIWYPALRPEPAAPAERAWSTLRSSTRTPAAVRIALALLLGRRRMSASAGAMFAPDAATSPVVIYNHGLISFAEENGSLMEELASHGHIAIAIEHLEQVAELRGLGRDQPPAQQRAARLLASRIAKADSAQRAALAPQYYAASTVTGRIVRERALDTRFVLHRLDGILPTIPGWPGGQARDLDTHLAGFSIGGAVATQVALHEPRALSVVNLDGGTQGPIDATALRMPYLMYYSEASAGMNDALLPAHATRETAAGTRHLNFHDVSGLVGWLRFTSALGRVRPAAFLHQRNVAVAGFVRLQSRATSGSGTASSTRLVS